MPSKIANTFGNLKCLALGFALLPLKSFSQADSLKITPKTKMQVDLPDETEETDLLHKHEVQIETSVLYNRYRNGEPSLIGLGMLRYGLSDKVELRLMAEDGYNRDKYLEETVQSTSPFSIGTKITILKNKKILPDITFVGYLKLPATSRSKEQTVYWSPILLLAFQNKLSGKWTLEYNGGIQQESFGRDWFWLASGSIHYEISGSVEVFAEYFGQYQKGEESVHNAGAGIAYQMAENWELFLSGGSTINYYEYNYFGITGLSCRF